MSENTKGQHGLYLVAVNYQKDKQKHGGVAIFRAKCKDHCEYHVPL